MKKQLQLILTLGLITQFSCTNLYMKRANEDYYAYRYQEAIKGYNKVLKKTEDTCAMMNLGRSYYKINELEKADKWYSKVLDQAQPAPPYVMDYVRLLITKKDYSNARVWLDVYEKYRPDDPMIAVLKEEMENSDEYVADSFLYFVKPLPINSEESSFSPVHYKEGIVFASQRPISAKVEEDTWTGKGCFNLFYAERSGEEGYTEPKIFSKELRTPLHEGPASFNELGTEIFFTRSNMKKNQMQTGQNNENNLEIYMADWSEGVWKNIRKFPFDNDNYSLGHPTVSPDGKSLYFVSNKPGGMGETDIYVSKKVNGAWVEPENLGEFINSPGKEMFPYFHTDTSGEQRLYFSTNGRPGLGGLDVYYSAIENGNFSPPVHMSYPINSTRDDFGVSISRDNSAGFLSSNRDGGEHGYDRIYEFNKIDQQFFLDVTVRDKETKEVIEGAKVSLENLTLTSERNTISDKDGKAFFELEQSSEFSTTARKKDYFNDRKTVSTLELRRTDTLEIDLYLARLEIEKPIRLENIYYDFDKWDIRPDAAIELDRLVSTLVENPKVTIELSSHTDSRGSDKYNMKLSDKRAKSAVDYLISKGIDKKRMVHKGYGESKLLNKCDDGVECEEEEHQFNRRTEFKVLSK